MKTLPLLSRLAIGITALSVLAALFLPIWKIELEAPQYPEGLVMRIWHNKLTGDVDTINGLNHYIGMRHITVESFPEFKILRYLILFFVAFGVAVALWGKRNLLKVYVSFIVLFGAAALLDFYRWGYDYGHNLDPKAPIQVPGMAYQPPVVGYKQLLNFGAFSVPDSGGWLIVLAGAAAVGALVWEYWPKKKAAAAAVALGLMFSLYGCTPNSGPVPIRYGEQECHFCKMTLMDRRFGAELVSDKGKVFVFDDLNCMAQYMADKPAYAALYVADYAREGQLIPVADAVYLSGEQIRSPMASGLAAFSSAEAAQQLAAGTGAQRLNWQELQPLLNAGINTPHAAHPNH